jgi:SAM-dependent methyltransferase
MVSLLKRIVKTVRTILLSPFIVRDYWRFCQADTERRFRYSWRTFFPQVLDKTALTGFDRHYVYHTAWAVRKVRDAAPQEHVDISSSLYFPALLSAFVPVRFYDYRPAPLTLDGLTTEHADVTALDFADNSIRSLSFMHCIEHIGLGRYGDPIDPEGDVKAAAELSRVLAPGGQLLLVTPVGREAMIQFNAHRIYTYEAVLALFPELTLTEFSYIPERGTDGIHENASAGDLASETYACGCFVFTKHSV